MTAEEDITATSGPNLENDTNTSINKCYNLSEVLKVSRGDYGFVRSVVHMFIVKTPMYIEKIVKAYASGNFKEMGEAAHQLKQSVYVLGINSLRIPVMSIVLVGRNNQPGDDLPVQISLLQKNAMIVIDELKNDFGM